MNFTREDIIYLFKKIFPNQRVIDRLSEVNGQLYYKDIKVSEAVTVNALISKKARNVLVEEPDGLYVSDQIEFTQAQLNEIIRQVNL